VYDWLARTKPIRRAVLAVFLPLIVCCGGGILFAFMFGFLGALSQHAH
jgi:hypothetical protein